MCVYINVSDPVEDRLNSYICFQVIAAEMCSSIHWLTDSSCLPRLTKYENLNYGL